MPEAQKYQNFFPLTVSKDSKSNLESYGLFHSANHESVNYLADTLFVFVHGILSTPRTWETFAQALYDRLAIDADAFALKYSSWPGAKTSNSEATRALKAAISAVFRTETRTGPSINCYRHIIVISHSNGGLIVKRWFSDLTTNTLDKLNELNPHLSGLNAPIALTVRSIVNIACPHAGATIAWSRILAMIYSANRLFLPMLSLLNQYTHLKGRNLGLNCIAKSLIRWNPNLGKYEDLFFKCINRLHEVCVSSPNLADFRAEQDVHSSDFERGKKRLTISREERSNYYVRGFHFLKSITTSKVLMDEVQETVPDKRRLQNFTLADHYCAINRNQESRLGIKALIGSGRPMSSGQQVDVLTWIRRWATDNQAGLKKAYVCGEAGVGKSRVLARLARDLLTQYLSSGGEPAQPVIYINLRETILSKDRKCESGSDLLEGILEAWTSFVLGIPLTPSNFGELVHEAIKDNTVIIIFDSLDDFLGRNPWIKWNLLDDVWRLFESQDLRCKKRVIVGVRTGEPIIDHLRKLGGWEQVTIDLMNEDDIKQHCSDIYPLIQRARRDGSSDVEEALATPLVAFAFEQDAFERVALLNLEENAAFNVARVYEYALRCIVRATLPPQTDYSEIELALNVLMLVGRISYFRPQRGYASGMSLVRAMSLEDIRSGTREISDIWAVRYKQGDVAAIEIFEAIKKSQDDDWLNSVLRTVLHSQLLGEGRWDFSHPRWKDFLVARYYAFCARHDHVDAFGAIAYLPNVTGLAGQILGEWNLDASTIREVAERSRGSAAEKPDSLYISNLMALTAWNPQCRLDGAAWEACVDVVCDKKQSGFSRALTMNVILIPWLRLDGAQQIPRRDLIIKALHECVKIENPTSDLVACQARSYLELLNQDIKIDNGDIDIGVTEESFEKFFSMPRSIGTERSLQFSIIQLVEMLREEAQQKIRGIATVHYILMLLFYWKASRCSEEAMQTLIECFRNDSFHDQYYQGKVKNYNLPKSARKMYLWCKGVWTGES